MERFVQIKTHKHLGWSAHQLSLKNRRKHEKVKPDAETD